MPQARHIGRHLYRVMVKYRPPEWRDRFDWLKGQIALNITVPTKGLIGVRREAKRVINTLAFRKKYPKALLGAEVYHGTLDS